MAKTHAKETKLRKGTKRRGQHDLISRSKASILRESTVVLNSVRGLSSTAPSTGNKTTSTTASAVCLR